MQSAEPRIAGMEVATRLSVANISAQLQLIHDPKIGATETGRRLWLIEDHRGSS